LVRIDVAVFHLPGLTELLDRRAANNVVDPARCRSEANETRKCIEARRASDTLPAK